MKYMGSKARIAKDILPIILKDRKPHQYYIEPFVGGCNMIDKVGGNRIGNDLNHYIIEMWKALQQGWMPPDAISEDVFNKIKNNINDFEPALIGFVGTACTFGSKWWGGYARNKRGANYAIEGRNNLMEQVERLKGVHFISYSYNEIVFSEPCIIYNDPPYKGTSQYKDKGFDHDKFWQWCRDKTNEGHQVFISEYNAPDDFECIWQKEINSSLTKDTGAKKGVEKLFRLKQ